MWAVRASRSALVARLPLLAGLCRLDLLLAETFVLPAFAFALPGLPVVLLAALVPLDVGVFFLPVVECLAAGFWSSDDWHTADNETVRQASTAARHSSAGETRGCWRKVALIISLYLYLSLLDA
jgi:hypothetical protein